MLILAQELVNLFVIFYLLLTIKVLSMIKFVIQDWEFLTAWMKYLKFNYLIIG